MKQSTLEWLQAWYHQQCDGDWEHGFGIHITTLDNPGWSVSININETELEGLEIEYKLEERLESDWYGIAAKKGKFDACGDPSKLELLLETFRQIVESKQQGTLMAHLEHAFPGRWQIKKFEESNSVP